MMHNNILQAPEKRTTTGRARCCNHVINVGHIQSEINVGQLFCNYFPRAVTSEFRLYTVGLARY